MTKEKLCLLVADDEEGIRKLFCRVFEENGYLTRTAKSEQEILDTLKERKCQIVILDIRMPGVNDIRVLKYIKKEYPELEVIVVSGHGTMRMAQDCLNIGAFDYLLKPVNIDDFLNVVDRAAKSVKQRMETKVPVPEAKEAKDSIGLTGQSVPIQSVLSLLNKIAPTASSVLIQGETGTGKELVARYIHEKSQRSGKRFISINCPALPDTLLESELFGHEPGAYTDASKLKKGLLEVADEGTLFLDEVADLSLALQAKLLRVVETKTFRRLGGNEEIHVDVRFLSASNKNLNDEISKGSFRQDLFYRLGVISLNLPPLRERQEDIPLLVYRFLKDAAAQGYPEKEVSKEVLNKLTEYHWPGNVRQLKNVIEQMVVLADKNLIEVHNLPNFIVQKNPEVAVNGVVRPMPGDEKLSSLEDMEKEHIRKALINTAGNQTKAAELLGISRRTLYQKIKEYGLE